MTSCMWVNTISFPVRRLQVSCSQIFAVHKGLHTWPCVVCIGSRTPPYQRLVLDQSRMAQEPATHPHITQIRQRIGPAQV